MLTRSSRFVAGVLILFAVACGGGESFPPDLALSADLSAPADLRAPADLTTSADLSAPADLALPPDMTLCGGMTVYPVQSGSYMTTSATLTQETCMLGLTAADLMDNRTVQNDGMGNLTVLASDNSTVIGTGPVSCNHGLLVQRAGILLSSGPCIYNQTSEILVDVTGPSQLTGQFTYSRKYMSAAGMTCTKPASCTIKFTATLKK